MQPQLVTFYELVKGELCPDRQSNQDQKQYLKVIKESGVFPEGISEKEVRSLYYQVSLKQLSEAFCREVRGQVAQLRNEDQIQDFIQMCQRELNSHLSYLRRTRFIDKLPEEGFSGDHTIGEIYRMIFRCMEEVMVDLEVSYPYHLDQDVTVPYRRWKESMKKSGHQLKQLFVLLEEKSIDPDLVEVLEKYAAKAFNYRRSLPVYRDMKFLEETLRVLLNFLNKENPEEATYIPGSDLTEQLVVLLCGLNFNAKSFTHYVITKIRARVRKEKTGQAKLDRLLEYSRCFGQLTFYGDMAFLPDIPSVRDQMGRWFEEELEFFQQAGGRSGELPDTRPEQKLCFNTTVQKLACFYRLLYDAQMIDCEKKEFFDFVSHHFCTAVTREGISRESFRKKYYIIGASTRKSVEGLLNKMLQQVRDDQMRIPSENSSKSGDFAWWKES